MHKRSSTVVAVVAAACVALASAAAAGTQTTGQRVAIESTASHTAFALRPLKAGPLKRDSGAAAWAVQAQRFVVRDGQSIEINDVDVSFAGARGTLRLRFRIEWIDAGHGYSIGAGTWKVVEGTGAYARVSGGGRSASSWPPDADVHWRAEGLLVQK
jgi:hypothetical protein